MTPPSPPTNLKPIQNSDTNTRLHSIPLSQNFDFKQTSTISRPDKIPFRQYANLNLSTGQSPVHSEILVHHGVDGAYLRPQSRPTIPTRNHQNMQSLPKRDYTKIQISGDPIPPRRTEVPAPVDNSFYDSTNIAGFNTNWKNEKKPLRNPQTRWPRPTTRPRLPIRITERPYSRPMRIERPSGPIRQPQFTHSQKLPTNNYYQSEFNNQNQQLPSSTALPMDSIQQVYTSEVQEQV
jgi:hypothetical protein